MPGCTLLYRPVGMKELELIFDSGMRSYPPRLPEQPIFYPVLNTQYARQIAKDWNSKADTFAGYVTRFTIDYGYIRRFEEKTVGGREHKELWVNAKDLEEFNGKIFGPIEVTDSFFGDGFVGMLPAFGFSKAANADDFFNRLEATLDYNGMDFSGSICMNSKSIFINYPYWKQKFTEPKAVAVIERMKWVWDRNYPSVRLPGEVQFP